ncbi:Mu-like prophage protein gp16 [[Luteovulum] sphaeroides subsp. megalophilum]|uniref:gp16 family protein n=1 Tax=Cereibacter sphaeroides TaxID=1063 RepID=UPI000B6A40F5|nr:regulatory protein GemA [Cereibacter sphaeroides]SNS87168.1 Mu-like prophage protein gp16 [[Luteovulum] sphaeroides subsp. megalophilum]
MTRRTLQKLVHVGCRELGLDEDTRRDLQLTLTGKASMGDMTEAELQAVVAGLRARGFQPESSAAFRRPAADRADVRFIHVLWGRLGKAGALKVTGRKGLNAFIRARFEKKWGAVPLDIDTLSDAGQINDVTRALKDWCARVGVKVA